MSLKLYVLCWQDLLCYLIDDGGFLVMSNQRDHWKKVGLFFFFICVHTLSLCLIIIWSDANTVFTFLSNLDCIVYCSIFS